MCMCMTYLNPCVFLSCSFSNLSTPQTVRLKISITIKKAFKYNGKDNNPPDPGGISVFTHKNRKKRSATIAK